MDRLKRGRWAAAALLLGDGQVGDAALEVPQLPARTEAPHDDAEDQGHGGDGDLLHGSPQGRTRARPAGEGV